MVSRRRYRLSRRTKKDLDEIWLHIARDNIDAATRFIELITDKFPLLASSPMMGRARDELNPGLRSFPVKSCVIFYRLEKSRIEIVRVVRGARDLKALFK